jgi:hypothetical protein
MNRTLVGGKGFVGDGCRQINFRRDDDGPSQKPM